MGRQKRNEEKKKGRRWRRDYAEGRRWRRDYAGGIVQHEAKVREAAPEANIQKQNILKKGRGKKKAQ